MDVINDFPGTMIDCNMDGTMYNKGKLPLGHIFKIDDDVSTLVIQDATIGNEPFPNLSIQVPVFASYATFDGKIVYFLDDDANIIAEGEIVNMN